MKACVLEVSTEIIITPLPGSRTLTPETQASYTGTYSKTIKHVEFSVELFIVSPESNLLHPVLSSYITQQLRITSLIEGPSLHNNIPIASPLLLPCRGPILYPHVWQQPEDLVVWQRAAQGYCMAKEEAASTNVGTQEGSYTKGGPLPTVNPIQRVMSSSIPLAKLGRAVTASTWQQTLRKYARQLIQGAG